MLGMSRVATAGALAPALAGWPGLREAYLDLPGHGDSPGEGAADSQTVPDAVCRWVDGHLEGPVLLAGSSYGGCLAAGSLGNARTWYEGYCWCAAQGCAREPRTATCDR